MRNNLKVIVQNFPYRVYVSICKHFLKIYLSCCLFDSHNYGHGKSVELIPSNLKQIETLPKQQGVDSFQRNQNNSFQFSSCSRTRWGKSQVGNNKNGTIYEHKCLKESKQDSWKWIVITVNVMYLLCSDLGDETYTSSFRSWDISPPFHLNHPLTR